MTEQAPRDPWWAKLIYGVITVALMIPVYFFIAKPLGHWVGGLVGFLLGLPQIS